MTSAVPASANEFIEQQLDARLSSLEQAFTADALSIMSSLTFGVDDLIRSMIEERHGRDGSRAQLVVFLTTGGGYIEQVARIVDTLRHYYQHVSFVIPNYAFSAGTVLAMSGDDIFMDYYSRLGPIDPQVQAESGRLVPALGYLKQWERLIQKSEEGRLTTAEAQLMIYGFDQAELYAFEQARELSVTLLKEWLVNYKFKNWTKTETQGRPVTPEMRAQRAEEIARLLNDTDRWHSHGYGISMAVLQQDLKLRIEDLAKDPEQHVLVKQYDGLLTDYMGKMGYGGMLHTVGHFRPLGSVL